MRKPLAILEIFPTDVPTDRHGKVQSRVSATKKEGKDVNIVWRDKLNLSKLHKDQWKDYNSARLSPCKGVFLLKTK